MAVSQLLETAEVSGDFASRELTVEYNSSEVTVEEIQQTLASVGYESSILDNPVVPGTGQPPQVAAQVSGALRFFFAGLADTSHEAQPAPLPGFNTPFRLAKRDRTPSSALIGPDTAVTRGVAVGHGNGTDGASSASA